MLPSQLLPRVCLLSAARSGIEHELSKTMYMRFVVTDINENSGCMLGVFHAMAYLYDDGDLHWKEAKEYDSLRRWFNQNLKKPTRFTASKRPYHHKKHKAISWFKESAHEHISRIQRYVNILENHGIPVQKLTAIRVGYVVYEDEYQITAEPFADMQC